MSITTMSMNIEKTHRWTDHKHCSVTLNERPSVSNPHLWIVQYADAPAVSAGSPPEKKFSRVLWPPESHSTADMRALRGIELQRTEKRSFWYFVFFGSKERYQDCRCFLYLRPSQTRRRRRSLPCLRVAAGTPPRTAPCTPPSAATFHSRTLSTALRLVPSQRSPRTGRQNRTGPGCDGQ